MKEKEEEQSFPPPFRTARLHFHPMVDADAAGIHAIRGLEEVMKWSLKKIPDADLDTTRDWVENYLRPQAPGNVGYVLRDIESQSESGSPGADGGGDGDGDGRGRIIASIGLRYGYVEVLRGYRWELGYIFHPDFWGKGYATEAVRGLMGAWPGIYQRVNWGDGGHVQQERSGEVVAITAKANEASIHVWGSVGLKLWGSLWTTMGQFAWVFVIGVSLWLVGFVLIPCGFCVYTR